MNSSALKEEAHRLWAPCFSNATADAIIRTLRICQIEANYGLLKTSIHNVEKQVKAPECQTKIELNYVRTEAVLTACMNWLTLVRRSEDLGDVH